MVLAHIERAPGEKKTQRQRVHERMRSDRMSPLPGPGVFATSSSNATPALLPDGSIAPGSVSKLVERAESRAGGHPQLRGPTRCAAIETAGPPAADDDDVRDAGTCRRPTTRSTLAVQRDGRRTGEPEPLPGPVRPAVRHRCRRSAGAPQCHRRVHVRRADAQRGQPVPGHLRPDARQPRRRGDGVLRDGGRRGRGRGRARRSSCPSSVAGGAPPSTTRTC